MGKSAVLYVARRLETGFASHNNSIKNCEKEKKMRKIVMAGLLLAVFGIMSVSAETWEQARDRVERMSDAVFLARNELYRMRARASNDQIGAFAATHLWISDVTRHWANAPSLTQAERNRYLRMSEIHREQFENLRRLINQMSMAAQNNIIDRAEHWQRHLNNGGTINFR